MYKVVEGHVPAINKDDYIQPQRQRQAIRATRFKDYEHKNIVENYSTNNSKCYKPIPAKTENFKKSSFFFLSCSIYCLALAFEHYRQVYNVHSGLQDESLQVTILKLP